MEEFDLLFKKIRLKKVNFMSLMVEPSSVLQPVGTELKPAAVGK